MVDSLTKFHALCVACLVALTHSFYSSVQANNLPPTVENLAQSQQEAQLRAQLEAQQRELQVKHEFCLYSGYRSE